MSHKTQKKTQNNSIKIRQDKVLTFFDQSTSNGMTRFYGVVCKKAKNFAHSPKKVLTDQKEANDA